MLREAQFVARRRARWAWWDEWLTSRQAGQPTAEPRALASSFRALCHDLAMAQDRDYSLALVDVLQARVMAAQQAIYGAASRGPLPWRRFFTHDLPQRVRDERRLVLISAGLLLGSLAMVATIVAVVPSVAEVFLGPGERAALERMYDPDGAARQGRGADQDWLMYGFYIANNVRIDFQCFAGGILFGAGSVFFLLVNGCMIGAAAGHLTAVGFGQPFWSFVAGHSAFELMGAVLSGAAGLMLGRALIAPGMYPRRHALVREASAAVPLLLGAAALTALAAIVEAFWSPLRAVPVALKYATGIVLWGLTALYLLRAGRDAD